MKVATLVAGALEEGQHRRLTKKDVVDVIAQAVRDGLVALDALQGNVRTEVQRVLTG
ncbi:MAG TPA: hypothetical protein VMT79_02825 [Candidatus Binatia bacterium]|nr:hypothetical protein [Candidatus Binatia bacterium]